MSNIICHPYHLVDESPWPLSGQIGDAIIINRIFLVFILFFTLFLISILFIDREKEKVKKANPDRSKGGNNTGGGDKGGKKLPSYFIKPRSLSPRDISSIQEGFSTIKLPNGDTHICSSRDPSAFCNTKEVSQRAEVRNSYTFSYKKSI